MGLFGGSGGSASSNLQSSSSIVFTPTLQLSSPSGTVQPSVSPSAGGQSATQTVAPREESALSIPVPGGGGFLDAPGTFLTKALDTARPIDTPQSADISTAGLGTGLFAGGIPWYLWAGAAVAAYLLYAK